MKKSIWIVSVVGLSLGGGMLVPEVRSYLKGITQLAAEQIQDTSPMSLLFARLEALVESERLRLSDQEKRLLQLEIELEGVTAQRAKLDLSVQTQGRELMSALHWLGQNQTELTINGKKVSRNEVVRDTEVRREYLRRDRAQAKRFEDRITALSGAQERARSALQQSRFKLQDLEIRVEDLRSRESTAESELMLRRMVETLEGVGRIAPSDPMMGVMKEVESRVRLKELQVKEGSGVHSDLVYPSLNHEGNPSEDGDLMRFLKENSEGNSNEN